MKQTSCVHRRQHRRRRQRTKESPFTKRQPERCRSRSSTLATKKMNKEGTRVLAGQQEQQTPTDSQPQSLTSGLVSAFLM